MERLDNSIDELLVTYGQEALAGIRSVHQMLQLVAALGRLRNRPWAEQGEAWERCAGQLVAQMEDTDLLAASVAPKFSTTEEVLRAAARNCLTLKLAVQRKDGHRVDIEVEPYGIREQHGEKYLLCYHIAHQHYERLALHRILYCHGTGGTFTPRFTGEI